MQAKKFRERLNQKEIIVAPGCYDAFSAKLVADTGFEAAYLTGYGSAASILGKPDLGLLTMTEMIDHARRVAAAVTIPVIADADTGYGNVLNVYRTVQEYARAGVAAIQLEDQQAPKKCGHTQGKTLISKEEHAQKIKAAREARGNSDLVIIARTDARAVTGFEDALDRCQAYVRAGADVIFFEAPQSQAEIKLVRQKIKDIPLLINMVEHGKTPLIHNRELEEIGYNIVIYPLTTLMTAALAIKQVLTALHQAGSTHQLLDQMVDFQEICRLVGFPEYYALSARFAAAPANASE
jgi:carboxyvinyl-carboxyphosphonate phosphorylmutase